MSAPDVLLQLEVNGVLTDMPDPMKCDINEQDIQTSKSGRDERGEMWSQHVATKYTADIGYTNEEYDNVAQVLNAIDNAPLVDGMKKLRARILNPKYYPGSALNRFITGYFYAGDRKVSVVQWMPDRANGKLMNLTFTLIEV